MYHSLNCNTPLSRSSMRFFVCPTISVTLCSTLHLAILRHSLNPCPPFPNFMMFVPFLASPPHSLRANLLSYSQLHNHLIEMICAALQHVQGSENRQLALWSACVLAHELIDHPVRFSFPSFPHHFPSYPLFHPLSPPFINFYSPPAFPFPHFPCLSFPVARLTQKQTHRTFVTILAGLLIDKIIIGHWGYQEVLSALLILRDLSYLHPKLVEIDEVVPSSPVFPTQII